MDITSTNDTKIEYIIHLSLTTPFNTSVTSDKVNERVRVRSLYGIIIAFLQPYNNTGYSSTLAMVSDAELIQYVAQRTTEVSALVNSRHNNTYRCYLACTVYLEWNNSRLELNASLTTFYKPNQQETRDIENSVYKTEEIQYHHYVYFYWHKNE